MEKLLRDRPQHELKPHAMSCQHPLMRTHCSLISLQDYLKVGKGLVAVSKMTLSGVTIIVLTIVGSQTLFLEIADLAKMGFSQKNSLERVPEPLPSTLTVPRDKPKEPHFMSHRKGICGAGFIIQSRKGLCHGQMALMYFECYINSNLMAHLFVGLKFHTIN